MAEQRLIDANAFLNKMMQTNRYFSVKFDICEAPTIDPETLPIVRQLRNELARVTAERDSAIHAVKKLIQEDSNPCVFCSKAGILCSGMNPDFCESFEWRGQQKEE